MFISLDFVYWFESQSTGEMPTDIGSCGRLGWIDGVTVYQPTDTCDLQLPYMCQTPGKVAKGLSFTSYCLHCQFSRLWFSSIVAIQVFEQSVENHPYWCKNIREMANLKVSTASESKKFLFGGLFPILMAFSFPLLICNICNIQCYFSTMLYFVYFRQKASNRDIRNRMDQW